MELSSRTEGDTLVVQVNAARIDAAAAIQFKSMMRSETGTGDRRVLLDLAAVEFIDSSGLGAVVAAMKYLGQDRSLELAGLTGKVSKVFRLTRMDSVFKIHPTAESATNPSANAIR